MGWNKYLGVRIILFNSTKFYMVRLKHLDSGIKNSRRSYRKSDSLLARWTLACSSPKLLFVYNTLTVVFGSTVIRRNWTRFSSHYRMMGISTTG